MLPFHWPTPAIYPSSKNTDSGAMAFLFTQLLTMTTTHKFPSLAAADGVGAGAAADLHHALEVHVHAVRELEGLNRKQE